MNKINEDHDKYMEKPQGLGIAIDIYGDIYDGYFSNGQMDYPGMKHEDNGISRLSFKTSDGRCFKIKFKHLQFLQAERVGRSGEKSSKS